MTADQTQRLLTHPDVEAAIPASNSGVDGSTLDTSGNGGGSRTNSLRRTAAFIATATGPPAPPPRRPVQREGTTHTAYYPPEASATQSDARPRNPSPPINEATMEDYRAPEALPASPALSMPDLIDSTADNTWSSSINPSWDNIGPSTQDSSAWAIQPYHANDYSGWATTSKEEENWWDKSLMSKGRVKPGPGCLPSGLMEMLHNDDHTPLQITVTAPDLLPEPPKTPSASTSIQSGTSSVASPSASSPSGALSVPLPPHPAVVPPSPSRATTGIHHPPLRQEVLEAVPHPHAYFCANDYGWLLIYPSRGQQLPTLSLDKELCPYPLPDDSARRASPNCLQETSPEFGAWNISNEFKTHHFHQYPSAVKGSALNPPFTSSFSHFTNSEDWDKGSAMDVEPPLSPRGAVDPEEDILLDLFVCCQCQTHVIATPPKVTIPTVISPNLLEEFRQDRLTNPALGRTGPETYMMALETLLKIVENLIWRQRTEHVKVKTSNALTSKVGWSRIVQLMFEELGFRYFSSADGDTSGGSSGRLGPPNITGSTPASVLARAKLLRAWVELGILAHDHQKRYARDLRNYSTSQKLWIKADSAREDIQRALGSHPDQMARSPAVDPRLLDVVDLIAWKVLGTTMSTHSAVIVEYAYKRQIHCHPLETIMYFTYLDRIRQWANATSDPSNPVLEYLFTTESSRGLWTSGDLQKSAKLLKLIGDDGKLPENLTSEAITQAWKSRLAEVKSALKALEEGGTGSFGGQTKDRLEQERRRLKDAFRIMAESTGDATVMKGYEDAIRLYGNTMDAKDAYNTMGVMPDLDDDTLLMVYSMRIQDHPLEEERMKQALMAIAEDRGSDRLKVYAETGQDAGPPPPDSARPEWPRGLEQLGNTCYLNSLLQYFYTIKDLRNAILQVRGQPIENLSISDDDFKRNRVGGRLVSKREVERSKQFVSLLSTLFFELAWSEMPSVKPELELAKLALVTSKDEEEEAKSESSDAALSAASGSTLVDEPMSMEQSTVQPTTSTAATNPDPASDKLTLGALNSSPSSSVLGKRPAGTSLSAERLNARPPAIRGVTVDDEAISETYKDGFVLVDKPGIRLPERAATVAVMPSKVDDEPENVDIEMPDLSKPIPSTPPTPVDAAGRKPPPLPPRKKAPVQQPSDSVMMFGKQHDVSECMDNCMFQIEAALQFASSSTKPLDPSLASSVVKKLFYGKIRQRIRMSANSVVIPTGSIHEREDLFSQLLVNVGEECFDLYDGLAGYFDDTVEFQGKEARMETAITELPPILQIQLQRVQFNREAMEAYKSQAYVKFGESIYMDRFMADADPEKKARSKEIQARMNICRERLKVLQSNKNGPFEPPFMATMNFLTNEISQPSFNYSSLDLRLVEDLRFEYQRHMAEAADRQSELKQLKAEMDSIWKEETKFEYELCSVFIHRGTSPSFGHYFFYARMLPDAPDSWFKYNDQDVTSISKSEVLADTTGSTANPYLLVFVKKGSGMVDTVHRINPGAPMETN